MKVSGELSFAGDKSLSHRAAIFTALAKGHSVIKNFLPAQDTLNTLRAMEMLGVRVEKKTSTEMDIFSQGILCADTKTKNTTKSLQIDLGNSGTGARLLLGLFSGMPNINITLQGDASLSKRPMGRVTNPLSRFGGQFEPSDFLPIHVQGQKLLPIIFKEELGSAQVKSAMLLAGIASQTNIRLEEEIPSRDHTENMLAFAGVPVSKMETQDGKSYVIDMEPSYTLQAREYNIWGDVSSAAFFVVLALLAEEGSLTIKNVLLNPYRSKYLDVLKRMGADIEIQEKQEQCGERGGDIIVRPSSLRGTKILPKEIPSLIDELPILTIAGLFSQGEFSFRGAKELRVKESDRIFALCENLRNCGVAVEELEDGLLLQGNPSAMLNGNIQSFMDHRIVMSFAVAKIKSQANGALSSNMNIEGEQWVETSFPDFYEKLSKTLQTNLIIALDGPAGSGKSTLAKRLAQAYNMKQIDSGAIYRSYTYMALQYCEEKHLHLKDEIDSPQFLGFLHSLSMEINFADNKQNIFVNGQDMEPFIRTSEITSHIHYIADHPQLRELVNERMRLLAKKYDVVVDGRDIGTVVFPHANLKLFIEADLQERVRRRAKELKEKNIPFNEETLQQEMADRDEQDKNRKIGALKRAIDAIFVDTTCQSLDVAFHSIQKIVDKTLLNINKIEHK